MINYGKHSINQSDIDSVVDVLKSDFITQGPKVVEFENDLKNIVMLNMLRLFQMLQQPYTLHI